MDMHEVMKLLVEVGDAGTMTPDHMPRFAGKYDAGGRLAYAIGYMKALLHSVTRE